MITSILRKLPNELKNEPFRAATVILIILSFVFIPVFSLDVGIPADEPIDLEYGIQSLNYFKSGGTDMSFAELKTYKGKYTVKTQKYYGALFEMFTAKLGQIIPIN
ncbi:MAG TPA: hypothetical protein VEP89_15240, partial [Draconibacterium sp.]|nr:hypothetical protein [Draconibacterium sp.]